MNKRQTFEYKIIFGCQMIVEVETGFINGTKLLSNIVDTHGNAIQIRDWINSFEFERMKEYYDNEFGRSKEQQLIRLIIDCHEIFRGYYIHPRLVPHALYWASPYFADSLILKIANVVEETEPIPPAILDSDTESTEITGVVVASKKRSNSSKSRQSGKRAKPE